jgi:preprotein translocase subunit SecG
MQKLIVFFVIALTIALVVPALAQPGSGGGMGPGGMGGRLYNPQTVTTVKGTVEKVEELTMGQGMAFRELRLKTDQGSLLVHLGPGWFLDEKKFVVKAGDTVEVTGSQVTLNNQPALIAREVKVNGATLKLRDDQGVPVWRGMGRGSGGRPGKGPGAGQGKGPACM